MATLKKLSPNLMVEDVNRTIDFYRDILGFTLITTVPEEGQFGWALMQRDGIEIMFQSRESLSQDMPIFKGRAIGSSLNFYIEVTGLKEFHQRIKAQVKIVEDFRTTFYGMQEFAIEDCNGYILSFAEPTK